MRISNFFKIIFYFERLYASEPGSLRISYLRKRREKGERHFSSLFQIDKISFRKKADVHDSSSNETHVYYICGSLLHYTFIYVERYVT